MGTMGSISISIFLGALIVVAVLALMVLLCVWTYRDAQHKGMNGILWTLVVLLVPSFVGLIIYLVVRIDAKKVKKMCEGRPNVYDMITNGEVQLVVNSPVGGEALSDDSYLRKAAIKAKVPYITTMAAAKATAKGIRYVKNHGDSAVKSLQELHSEIRDK